MENDSLNKTPTEEEIYLQKFPKGKFLGGIIAVFFLSFVYNFPLKQNIERIISNQIQAQSACPIDFSDIEVSYFLPKVDIHNIFFAGPCNGQNLAGLKLSRLRLTFLGPSLSPLGVRVKIDTKENGFKFISYISVSPSGDMKVFIEDTGINTQMLQKVTQKPLPFSGRILVNGSFLAKATNSGITPTELSIKLESFRLIMPKQTVNFLELPQMNLGPVIFHAETKGNGKNQKLEITKCFIGDNESDIEIDLNGHLIPNFQQFDQSISALKGKIRIGKKVTDVVPMTLLNSMVLKGAQPKENFYRFSLDGPLSVAKPRFK